MGLITLPHGVFIIDTSGSEKGVSNNPLVVNAGTGSVTVSQATASNLNATITGSVAVINFPATQSVTGTVGITNFPTVQTVTGTVVADAGNGVFNITGTVSNPFLDVALSTRLSEAQFTSSVAQISSSLNNIKDDLTARVNLLGQNVMTGSTPVVIASDQSEYPVVQGTAAALSGAWTVRVTDGTNVLPTADVQTRAQYNFITDGINNVVAVKTGSAAATLNDNALVTAFSPNTQLPSGSNTIGYVMQGLSASLSDAWPVRVTDGINILPTGDSISRSIYMQITDGGTGSVSVIGASASPTVFDKSLVVQISPNQDPIPTTVVPSTAIPGSAVGRASGLTANVFVPVRQTNYIEQTTAAQRSFVSTNANDSSAGTGARQIILYYLNAAGEGPFSEIITLNGLTAVNTTNTDICFIERIMVISVGSNGSNVGTINMYTGTGATGTIFASVGLNALATGVGDNETFWAQHYIPSGSQVAGYYVSCGIVAAAGGGSSTSLVRYRNPTVATSPWRVASDIINAAQGNSASRVYYVSIKIQGPAVLLGYSTPGNNNSIATLSFDYSDEPI